jgi:phosphoribosyl 1,2-cyclic phosphate phosphodiesterase
MPVYATKQVQGALKREFPYVFSDFKYPGIPKVELIEIEGNEVIKIGEMNITPIEVMHYKLPVTAFRVGGLSYITDANYISDDQRELIKGSDIIVINALRRENHISHFNLNQALEFIAEMNPRKAYLTHISHHMGLHKDVQKELPENVEIAYDGLKIDFG